MSARGNVNEVFLPMDLKDAERVWHTLSNTFVALLPTTNTKGILAGVTDLCVRFLNADGFSINLGGWEIRYDKPEGTEKNYTAKYVYKNVEVWITNGVLYFSGPGVSNHLGEIVNAWSEELKSIHKERRQNLFIDPAGTFPPPCRTGNPLLLTGEIIEYLWQEGYQFDDYLGGSYLPDADRGKLVIQMFENGLDEQEFLKRARLWYLSGLAEKNLEEAIKVYLQIRHTYDNKNPDFPVFLGKVCENIIDNLKLSGVEDYALRWTSIFENVPVKEDEEEGNVDALIKNQLDALLGV